MTQKIWKEETVADQFFTGLAIVAMFCLAAAGIGISSNMKGADGVDMAFRAVADAIGPGWLFGFALTGLVGFVLHFRPWQDRD